jgi:uncharacterized membrane protein YeaQ/YmgE (transglycosylase-associated protein family)
MCTPAARKSACHAALERFGLARSREPRYIPPATVTGRSRPMSYVIGFVVWIVIGLLAASLMRTLYPAAATAGWLTFAFGIFGAFVGGMLAASGYVYHQPTPLRSGALIGAVLGGFFFTYIYHLVARKGI